MSCVVTGFHNELENQPTIVTTNYPSPQGIAEVLGGAVASRLSTFTWLHVAGADLRQRSAR